MITMILNIFPDYFSRHFITYSANKIPVFPKLTTPKLLLNSRIFPEYHAGSDTLQHRYYPRNAVPRWKRQKYMYMISSYFHRINLKLIGYRNLLKYTLYSLLYVSSQNPFPILRCPYKMIFRVIYRMTCSSQCHAVYISYSPLPPAGKLFIPV